MSRFASLSLLCRLAAVLCALGSSPLHAETTDCTPISYLPYTITTQGVYCLTGNLNTAIATGNAITVDTNNVIIDLNGWKLGDLAAGPATQANGIYALQRKNITIKNGTIRGFQRGIFLQDYTPHTTSQAHLIEDIRADLNTLSGISVYGQGSIVRRNVVVATGIPSNTSLCGAFGIETAGPGVRVLNNDVSETRAGLCQAAGISVKYADGSMIRDNRVSGVSAPSGSWGILVSNSDDVVARANDISDPGELGLTITIGGGIYMDNLVTGASVNPYSGTATSAGGRNYSN